MKPIICTEYLERWYECGQTIKNAKTLVIVGYSFGVADEHFNDLIRKRNEQAKLVVIDPSLEGIVNRVCQTVDQDKATFALCYCSRSTVPNWWTTDVRQGQS